jgi:AcrR family transcriptional regulator
MTPDADLIWTRPERPRRRREPLTRQAIVGAAMQLADARGVDGLSTRAIATRLGTGPTSMYWHVPTQADLYELMVDEAIGEIALPAAPSGDWRADLRALAGGTLAIFTGHPWLAQLGVQPGVGPCSRRYGEFAIAVLTAAGVGHEAAIQATAVVNNYVIGFAQRRAAWQQLAHRVGLAPEWDARLDRYLAALSDTDPALAEHVEVRSRLVDDDNFALGLECVLDGVAGRLVAP